MASNPLENFIHQAFRVAARVEFEPLNDKQLLQRYVEQRDQLAFGEVARRHGKMIWQVCWHTLGHRQDAEDAFQATFMTLIRRASSILWRESIDGWLHHVACQIATKTKIKRSQQHAREERRAAMRKEDYIDPANERGLGEVLDKELDRLPEKYRSPLILCYLEGLTQEQAAQRMNIPLRTFARQLAEGKERLRTRLSGRGMELDTAMILPGLSSDASLPSGLVEKTLDMARILTLSNGALETAGISPQVAALAKSALGVWTVKVKICLGILLLALGGVGTGVARYPGFFLQLIRGEPPRETQPDPVNQNVDESQTHATPPRTDCYGDPLPPGVMQRLGTVRFRNNTAGFGFVLTPDKTNPMIVCSGGDWTAPLRLWDLTTGKPLSQFYDSDGQAVPVVTALDGQERQTQVTWAISWDGRLLARCDNADNEFRFWDMSTRKVLGLRSKEKPDFLAISPDGRTVAVISDAYLYGWDSATGKKLWSRKNKNYWHSHLVYNADGTILMSVAKEWGPKDKKTIICRWEVATGKQLAPWIVADKEISGFAWSRDGGTLAFLPEWAGNAIQLWNMATGKPMRLIRVKEGVWPGVCMALSPDGKILATSTFYREEKSWSLRGKISLWNSATGQHLRDCTEQDHRIHKFVFSYDGKRLVSTLVNDHTIQVWEVDSGKEINPIWLERGERAPIRSLDGRVLWDANVRAVLRPMCLEIPDWRNGDCRDFAITRDGTIAASFIAVSEQVGGVVRLWEVATGKELRNCSTIYKPCRLTFSPDGKFLACTVAGEQCFVWDVATGKQIAGNIIGCAKAFFPDGKMLVTCMETGLCIWETATGKKLHHIPKGDFEYNFQQVAISADGQILAAVGNVANITDKQSKYGFNSKVYLWQVDASKQTVRLERPRQLVKLGSYWTNQSVLTFSRDGRTLATSDSFSPIIHVWEIATGNERYRLNDHPCSCLASCPSSFSSDGRRLASGHHDTTVLIWDLTGRLDGERLRPTRLSAQAMEARWADLASTDAARAGRALWSMVAAGSPTVSFLRKRLRPIERKPVTEEAVAKLIADLDHNVFAVRKTAREELKKLGEAAEASLRQALDNKPSLELRRSIDELLKAVEEARSLVVPPAPEVLRSIRAIEVLEQIGTPEAQQLLSILSRGAAGARQTLDARAALFRLQQVARR